MFGAYRLVSLIGRGRTAEVFRAERRGIDLAGPVVVKRIRPEVAAAPESLRRLEDEARILARLRHPAIPRLHDFGRAHGTLYVAMEHLDGCPAGRVMRALDRQGRWPHVALGAHVVREVASALAYAHAARDQGGRHLALVHGGVNLRTVHLLRSGAVKLGSFSAGKPARGLGGRLRAAGLTPTAVAYLAPEQLRDEPVDHRADVYALGVLLWELLAGRPLFRATDPVETAAKVLLAPVPSLSAIRRDVPLLLEAVTMRALQRVPAQRYQSAEEIAEDLTGWLHGWPGGRRSLGRLVSAVVARAEPPAPPLPLLMPPRPRTAELRPASPPLPRLPRRRTAELPPPLPLGTGERPDPEALEPPTIPERQAPPLRSPVMRRMVSRAWWPALVLAGLLLGWLVASVGRSAPATTATPARAAPPIFVPLTP